MSKIEGYIDFDKELEAEQYGSLEYVQGEHDGFVEAIGCVQRAYARGEDVESIIGTLFKRLYEKFDRYKDPAVVEQEKELFRK